MRCGIDLSRGSTCSISGASSTTSSMEKPGAAMFKVCSKRAVRARLARSPQLGATVFAVFHEVASRDVLSFVVARRVTWWRAWYRCEMLAGLGCHVLWREADLVLGKQQAGDVAVWLGSCGSARSGKEEGRPANDSCQLESHD